MSEKIPCYSMEQFVELCIKHSKESEQIRPELKLSDEAMFFITTWLEQAKREGKVNNDDAHMIAYIFLQAYNYAMESRFGD